MFMNLQMCLCACICICTYVCNAYAFASECVYTHLPTYICICIYTYTYTYVSMQANIHAYFFIRNLYCLSRTINRWCKKHILVSFIGFDQHFFLHYWLIGKSTELLKLKGRAQIWISKWKKAMWILEHDVVHFGTILSWVNIHITYEFNKWLYIANFQN